MSRGVHKEAQAERATKVKRDAKNKKEREEGVQSGFGHDP
jgi:hypothetical protein